MPREILQGAETLDQGIVTGIAVQTPHDFIGNRDQTPMTEVEIDNAIAVFAEAVPTIEKALSK